MKSISVVFVVVTVYLSSNEIQVISFPFPQADMATNPDCVHSQSDIDAFGNATEFCMNKLKLKDLPEIDENFAKNGYPDKCIFNCIMSQMGLLTDSGDANDDAMMNLIKAQNMAAPMQQKFETLTVNCLASSRNLVEKDGGPKGAPCVFAAAFEFCFGIGEDEICRPPKT